MKDRYWNNLIGSLRHGQCILVLGSDLPVRMKDAGCQGDPERETSLAEELRCILVRDLEEDNRSPSGNTLAAIAQQYEDSENLGPILLRDTAERILSSPKYGPSRVHEMLAQLPFSLILTTTQSSVFTHALEEAGKSPSIQRYHMRGDKRDNPEFDVPASPRTPIVFHLFGTADLPSSLVLSENDVLDFLIRIVSERPPLPNSLLKALKRDGQSFLFVGFGIQRWDLRVLLKVLLRSLELNRNPAIAAEPLRQLIDADRREMVLFYQRGTRVELEDEEIPVFLEKLTKKLQDEGGYIEQNAPQFGTRLRVFISYAREDKELAARVFNSLQKASFEPWLDQEALQGGDDWNRRIESDLDNSHFVLVLYTTAFCRKTDSYVNKEVALATERALRVRGSFLIPLRVGQIDDRDRVDELRKFDEMELHESAFDEDIAKVISTMKRAYQLRIR